ncbi:MAG: hypothetical protein ABL962_05495 [Fimbriimonadaceae bacterium]
MINYKHYVLCALAAMLVHGLSWHQVAKSKDAAKPKTSYQDKSLLGNWKPLDSRQAGLTRVQILKGSKGSHTIQAWYLATYGQHVPWPKAQLHIYDSESAPGAGQAATATWRFDTGVETWVVELRGKTLHVRSYTRFLDDRKNCWSEDRYVRAK